MQTEQRLWVARAVLGDEEAFRALVHRFTRPLAWFIQKLGVAPSSVEDVLQNTWLAAWQSLIRLQDGGKFTPWLYGIARNKARQFMGSPRDKTTALNEETVVVEENDHDDIFRDLYLPHLSIALDRLSLIHREVLILRFLEDMAYEDISAVLAISLGTTKSRLHNAKQALRQQLEMIARER